MRKLASVRVISSVRNHPNADRLDLVEIDGWQCVAGRGEFKQGDLCVYFEIDAYLPNHDIFDGLRKSCLRSHPELGEGLRIKTVKLRGELSQGLAYPLNKLKPLGIDYSEENVHFALRSIPESGPIDITEFLGVKKYEAPVRNTGNVVCGNARSTFPTFVPKTDQERIQNLFGKLSNRYRSDSWEVTLKLDGSSMTCYAFGENAEGEFYEGNRFGVCSRNMDIKLDSENSDFVRTALASNLDTLLVDYCTAKQMSLAIQGELMGPRIQKNREELEHHIFFLFDVFDINSQRYYTPEERADFYYDFSENYLHRLSNGHKYFQHVPIIGTMEVFEEFGGVKDLIEWARQPSMVHPVAEGFVFKNMTDASVTFKVINNEYLLKCDTEE